MAKENILRVAIRVLWGDLQTNEPWQRIAKYSLAVVVAVILAILPSLADRTNFLVPMVVVFAHPGQRMGIMIESLLMILLGAFLGVVWSLLGLFLANLVVDTDQSAAYTVRGVFLLVAVLLHGFVRSYSPRLFNFVLFMLVTVITTLQFPTSSTVSLFSSIYVPVLLGGAVSLGANLALFPELSSSYLGSSSIVTISEAMDTLSRATYWFTTPGGDSPELREQRQRLYSTTSRRSGLSTQQGHWFSRIISKEGWRKFLSGFPSPFHKSNTVKESSEPLNMTSIAGLTERKTKIRSQLQTCRGAQNEVNFEISLSALPPVSTKPITTDCMTSLVQNIVTVIGTCENKFVLLGTAANVGHPHRTQSETNAETHARDSHPSPNKSGKARKRKTRKSRPMDDVKLVKEIEAGSTELLESILERIRGPVMDFHSRLKEAVTLLTVCLAHCLDVAKLPSGTPLPKGIRLEEVDIQIDAFADALVDFDAKSAKALKSAATDRMGQSIDFMPRMETFLISSFLLAFRQSAAQIMIMLRHARHLVELRQSRHGRSRLWMPKYASLGQWLSTGGEQTPIIMSESSRKVDKQEKSSTDLDGQTLAGSESNGKQKTGDEEAQTDMPCNGLRRGSPPSSKSQPTKGSRWKRWTAVLRKAAADAVEWTQRSDDLVYAAKLSIAVFLVSWPALVPSYNQWYSEVRGIWAPLQLILVFELAIGTSLIVFFLRLFGVLFGGIVGYLSYEIARGNRAGVVVVLLFGIVPSIYIQVATKYVKAGMISIVSMTVVALSTVNSQAPGYEVFYKRLVAFLVGGLAAMVIEMFIYPVRARDRLVDSLSASVIHVQNMHAAVAVGIDHPERPNFRSQELYTRFKRARDKAQVQLTAAETYLPSCLTEPRVKGSFKPLAPIYGEIIYVMHQIIDRMDNVVQLRREYGSSILEDLNPRVYTYRRNVVGSCNLILFSVNEALTTWLPLPQFLPSARLAQLRLVNRVRELLGSDDRGGFSSVLMQRCLGGRKGSSGDVLDDDTAHVITQRKFLSWNASTAGQMEIIEYLEELTDLVKLLVGVNAFRSGMLETPKYRKYMRQLAASANTAAAAEPDATAAASSSETQEEETGETPVDYSMGFPDVSVEEMLGNAPRLDRAYTAASSSSGRRPPVRDDDGGRGGDGSAVVDEEAGEPADVEDIPVSLQRVGSRMRQNDAVVRRRAFTVGDEGRRG